jgi:hypothetical protein
MEPKMQYKTIILHLLEERPEIYDQLRRNRLLLPTLERYARELKTHHEYWKEQLSRTRPGSESQIASEALELALKDLVDILLPESSLDETLSLDAAMAFLRQHMPPA